MNRTYKIRQDYVMFVEWKPHKNHSREHLHPVSKGTFQARNTVIKWIVGTLWKYCGIGGRQ